MSRLGGRLARLDTTRRFIEGRPRARKVLVARARAREYTAVWRMILGDLASQGAHTIVDSSKTARHNAFRPAFLVRELGVDVKVLHLVRTWAGLKASVSRGSNRHLSSQADDPPFPVPRAWLGQRLADWQASRLRNLVGADGYMRVSHDELQNSPAACLLEIGRFINFDMSSVADRVRRAELLGVGHLVGGNRLRNEGAIRLGTPAAKTGPDIRPTVEGKISI